MMKPRNEMVREYDFLRIITTFLVIIGHSTYYTISTEYGGIDFNSCMATANVNDSKIHILASIAKDFIYTFHMPLFMFLSGALFYMAVRTNRFPTFKDIVINKAKRLLIPFVAISIMLAIPMKYICGYWVNSENVLRDILLGQLLLQGNTYLWFLPALFLIFLVSYLVEKYTECKLPITKMMIYCAMYYVSFSIKVNIVKYLMQYMLWFNLGYFFEQIRPAFNQKVKISWIFPELLCMVMLFMIQRRQLHYRENLLQTLLNSTVSILLAVIGIAVVYEISRALSLLNWNPSSVGFMTQNSFGLYLYSDPWNYLVLFMAFHFFPVNCWGTELFGALMCFARIILTTLIALIITGVLRKLRCKYLI